MELEDSEDDYSSTDPYKGVYVKYDQRLHGPRKEGQKDPLSTAFLRKYIKIAKNRTQ